MHMVVIQTAKAFSITCAFVLLLLSTDRAIARPGQRVEYGWREQIVHVGELPPDVKAELKETMGHDLKIGFIYGHCYFFDENFDLWTWNGRRALFEGEKYWALTDKEFIRLVGRDKFASFHKPLYYRFPIGLTTLIAIGCMIYACVLFFPSINTRVKKILSDARYQQALQVYCANLPTESEPDQEDKARAWEAGLAFLGSQSVPVREAELNFGILINEADRAQSYSFRNAALAHEEAGNLEQSLVYFQKAAELREKWDKKDHRFLVGCIKRVQRQLARQRKA